LTALQIAITSLIPPHLIIRNNTPTVSSQTSNQTSSQISSETSSQSFSRTPSQSYSRTPSQQSMMTSDIIIKYPNINVLKSYRSSYEEVISHQLSHESHEEEA
ncbi:8357_t:CDS:1, partial [Funneliformis caledonium]